MSTTPVLLILGATGFIGRNMVEHFARDTRWQVRAVYHLRPPFDCPGIEWIQADLREASVYSKILKNAHTVVQAAATTSGSKDIVNTPYMHVTDNAVLNSLLFRACHEASIPHVIFFSCSVMYPVNRESVSESDYTGEIHPRYFGVGHTKVYIEKMAEFYAGLGRTRHTVIRHSNIYGPHDKFDLEKGHVFGATLTKIKRAREQGQTSLKLWGEGKEIRDLLHVDDLVSFVDWASHKQDQKHLLVNVGLGEGISIKELVKLMLEVTQTDLAIEHDLSAPSIPVDIVLDIARAQGLGWKPQIPLREGIKRTWAWLQQYEG